MWCLLSNFYLNMFRASLCPSSGELHCEGHCSTSRKVTFTMHTARVPAPHNHSHHNQCRTPYAAVHTLVLLTMGIMMPKTCWDKSLIINIRLVASCWFLSLSSPYVHDARSQEPKKCFCVYTCEHSVVGSFVIFDSGIQLESSKIHHHLMFRYFSVMFNISVFRSPFCRLDSRASACVLYWTLWVESRSDVKKITRGLLR